MRFKWLLLFLKFEADREKNKQICYGCELQTMYEEQWQKKKSVQVSVAQCSSHSAITKLTEATGSGKAHKINCLNCLFPCLHWLLCFQASLIWQHKALATCCEWKIQSCTLKRFMKQDTNWSLFWVSNKTTKKEIHTNTRANTQSPIVIPVNTVHNL